MFLHIIGWFFSNFYLQLFPFLPSPLPLFPSQTSRWDTQATLWNKLGKLLYLRQDHIGSIMHLVVALEPHYLFPGLTLPTPCEFCLLFSILSQFQIFPIHSVSKTLNSLSLPEQTKMLLSNIKFQEIHYLTIFAWWPATSSYKVPVLHTGRLLLLEIKQTGKEGGRKGRHKDGWSSVGTILLSSFKSKAGKGQPVAWLWHTFLLLKGLSLLNNLLFLLITYPIPISSRGTITPVKKEIPHIRGRASSKSEVWLCPLGREGEPNACLFVQSWPLFHFTFLFQWVKQFSFPAS